MQNYFHTSSSLYLAEYIQNVNLILPRYLMRVARQAPTAVTGRLVDELKAKRQHEGENTLEKRLPIAQQMKVCLYLHERALIPS